MKVRFVQSGGFAGLVKGCELDTASLPAESARQLEQLVRQSGIRGSGVFLSDSGRDLQQYEITFEGGPSASVVYDDSSLPLSAKPLIGLLKQHARPQAVK